MKQKTHSATKKRVKLTGSGKMKFQKSARNHLLSSKSKRQKNLGRTGISAPKSMLGSLSRLMNIAR